MKTGFVKYEGDLYYMTETGAEQKQWVSTEEDTYYFGSDGRAAEGWTRIEGVDYYFTEKHTMKTGWLRLDGKSYFLNSGALVRGPIFIDDRLYVFSEDGSAQKGWVIWNNVVYYCTAEGIPAVSTTMIIDGRKYSFTAYGGAYEI